MKLYAHAYPAYPQLCVWYFSYKIWKIWSMIFIQSYGLCVCIIYTGVILCTQQYYLSLVCYTFWLFFVYSAQALQTSNTLFTNGENDPWAKMSVTKSLSSSVRAIVISGACKLFCAHVFVLVWVYECVHFCIYVILGACVCACVRAFVSSCLHEYVLSFMCACVRCLFCFFGSGACVCVNNTLFSAL